MKLACLIGSAALVLVAAGADLALVTNGGFERVVDGKTEGWREVGSHYVYRDGEGRSGTRALCFENSDPLSTWVWDPSFTRATGVFGPTPKLIPSERNKQLSVELAPLEPALVRLSR